MADFNADSGNNLVKTWGERLDAVTREPEGETCFSSGGAPSKIDFLFFSDCLTANFRKVIARHDVPFKPHVALEAVFCLNLAGVRVRKFMVPKPLPQISQEPFSEQEWRQAAEIAEKHVQPGRFFHSSQRGSLFAAAAARTGFHSLVSGLQV